MKLPSISDGDGRRAWTFLALVGGAMVFTVFAAVGVFLVRQFASYSFYLALAAHAQVALVLLSLGALLVKRTISAGRDGLTYADHGEAAAQAAKETAAAADRKADEIASAVDDPDGGKA